MADWEAAEGGGDDAADAGGGGGGDDQDDLAAEWEAMMAGDGDDAGAAADASSSAGQSTRVLNQDEIDSLLGFDDEHEEGVEKSGIQAILNSALVSYERLPMLEVVFDRLVRLLTTTLRTPVSAPSRAQSRRYS